MHSKVNNQRKDIHRLRAEKRKGFFVLSELYGCWENSYENLGGNSDSSGASGNGVRRRAWVCDGGFAGTDRIAGEESVQILIWVTRFRNLNGRNSVLRSLLPFG